MSGQFSAGFSSPGHQQNNFNNQIINPMAQQMRNQQMGNSMSGQLVNMNNMGIVNQMGLMNQQQQQMGNYNQPGGNMMHQAQPIQSPNLGGLVGSGGLPLNAGMQSPSHVSPQQGSQQQSSQIILHGPTMGNQMSLLGSQQQQQQPQIGPQQQQLLQQHTGNLSVAAGSNLPNQQLQQQQQQLQQQQQQQKEFNIVSLCRFGQETVQDILSRFQEVFVTLKNIQPPTANAQLQSVSATTEKKVTEQFRTIRLLFKRLRLLFDKCNDSCQQDLGIEYTHIESLIPLKDEVDHKPEPAPSEEYKKHLQENRELIDAVMLKNKQLREVIDRLRIIIWEINTMLSMRKS